jgi:hypothetical protein
MGAFVGQLISSLMGNQSNTSSNSTSNSTSNVTGNQNSTGNSTVTPNENPIFTAFRESILPAIAQQFANAQQPVYGPAQEAQFVNNANNIYGQAMQGAQNNAARRGAFNSGAMDAAQTNLDQSRAGQIANFYSQIPLLNQQNSFNQTQNLLGLATQFLGQSPIGSTTIGNNSSTFGQNASSTNNTSSNSKSSSNPELFGIPL